ncbi:TadE/TadG family type IV pilus assembly protein [Jiella sp. M17.18]|uniref:TadE/TadG family type IV pilus assembly protein n=1 Tax=Jiella sp. M17.18 TaxID=3234247 RepID=UPI0034E003CA
MSPGWKTAQSPEPKHRRGLRAFLRDRRGATAIEFAILAGPFFILMLVLLETSTIFIGELVLDRAVAKVGREVRTGQATNAGVSKADFRQMICDEVSFMMNCGKLQIDLQSYGTFSAIPTSIPVKNGDIDASKLGYALPTSETITALRVYYKWPLYTDVLREMSTTMSDHSFVLVASAAFRTEPF